MQSSAKARCTSFHCTAVQKYCQHWPSGKKKQCILPHTTEETKGRYLAGTTPIGHNTLSKTVYVMQQELVVLKQTMHSLRVTSATRLFQSGMDEQLIMGRTGHRSIDGIRTYKRVSNEQKEDISNVLNSATNGDIQPQPKKLKVHDPQSDPQNPRHSHSVTIPSQSGPPVIINLTSCSSITINYTN